MTNTTIKLRYIRHSAKKIRPFARLFVGKKLDVAIQTAAVMPQDSARFLRQAFLMAQAAATQKELKTEEVVITEIMATEGPRIKRSRANARGRSNAYQKQIAHVVVSVGQAPSVEKVVSKTKKTASKKEKN